MSNINDKSKKQEKLAVLIDADNAQPLIIDGLLAEIAKYGIASVKRIYGDWTSPNLKSWKESLLAYAIQPIQQFAYTSGKNATDSSMIIDAMDLLYTEKLDGFCIVTSDSDFTRLSSRIREAGLTVYGFGEKKTPKAFVAACDKFIYTEILRDHRTSQTGDINKELELINMLRKAVEESTDESGWAYLGRVGIYLSNKSPEFDSRNYGYNKLAELIKDIELFKIDERDGEKSPSKSIYVKCKRCVRYERKSEMN